VLDRRLAEVAARASMGALPDLRIADGAIRVAPLDAAVPEAAQVLAGRLAARLPRVRITDLLEEVAG
jgi:hypothetical protein